METTTFPTRKTIADAIELNTRKRYSQNVVAGEINLRIYRKEVRERLGLHVCVRVYEANYGICRADQTGRISRSVGATISQMTATQYMDLVVDAAKNTNCIDGVARYLNERFA